MIAMEMKEFLLFCRNRRIEDLAIHYRDGTYTTETEPSIYDVVDEIATDAEHFETEIFIEVPSEGLFFRKAVLTEEVSPLALQDADTTLLPQVTIEFSQWTGAPEKLILERQLGLEVISWKSLACRIPDDWPSLDSSFGIPFGSYELEVRLPELPDLSQKTATVIVDLKAKIDLDIEKIQTGRVDRDYSEFAYSIKGIDPPGYRVFLLIKERIENGRKSAVDEAILSHIQVHGFSGDFAFPNVNEDQTREDQFQVSRNMVGYRFLYFIENQIRTFLWDGLKSIYSQSATSRNWWKGCFPEDIRTHILDKMSTKNPILDNLKQETTPLHYCSFNELGQIIEKEWTKLFSRRPLDKAPFFGHMSYLENIRNAIAHSRPLASGEMTILLENGRSILGLLGIKIPRTLYAGFFGTITL